jgi:hypothetical protein
MAFTDCTLRMRGVFRRLLAGLALTSVSAALLACQPSIEIVQPVTAPIVSVTTVVPPAHDVAIMGVDFDPPLDYDQIVANGGVTLLVAVKNLGLTAESNLEVSARLFDPAGAGSSAELLNETARIRLLAPGEVRVVRFNQASDLPVRKQYELVVDLLPVPGERELRDNSRSYDILVHGGE